jgi:hypothetical protein
MRPSSGLHATHNDLRLWLAEAPARGSTKAACGVRPPGGAAAATPLCSAKPANCAAATALAPPALLLLPLTPPDGASPCTLNRRSIQESTGPDARRASLSKAGPCPLHQAVAALDQCGKSPYMHPASATPAAHRPSIRTPTLTRPAMQPHRNLQGRRHPSSARVATPPAAALPSPSAQRAPAARHYVPAPDACPRARCRPSRAGGPATAQCRPPAWSGNPGLWKGRGHIQAGRAESVAVSAAKASTHRGNTACAVWVCSLIPPLADTYHHKTGGQGGMADGRMPTGDLQQAAQK